MDIRQRGKRFSLSGIRGITILVVAVVLAFIIGSMLSGGSEAPPQDPASEQSASQPTLWTCSMHPQIKLPEPGKCPICFMDLIPLESGMGEDTGPRQLRMSETSKQLAQIQTMPAVRGFAEKEVRMYGRIDYDESRLSYITAWVPGRLDRLYADYTGVTVKKGDHLVYMYSPELLSAQQELLEAREAVAALGNSASSSLRNTAKATVDAAREKLRLFGLTTRQVEEIENTRKTTDHLTIYAPVGGVVVHKDAKEGMYVSTGTRIYTIADLQKLWVFFEAYESDLPWLHYGQRLTFTARSFPGETFEGTLSFIDPLVDPKTRTVKVRAVVDNTGGRLKPDMLVTGTVQSTLDAEGNIVDLQLADKWMCPMHPEVVRDRAGTCPICGMNLVPASSLGFVREAHVGSEAPILIPASAPLLTGTRAVVYVQVPNDEGPLYEGREVTLGPRAGNQYVVKSGISEGEQVVTHGAFKIDSELQIQAKPSMMSPEGGAAPMHDHGDQPATPAPASQKSAESAQARAAVAPIYSAYFDVQMALANDDLAAAKKAAGKLVGAAGKVDMKLFSHDGHKVWMAVAEVIETHGKRLAGASDMKDARDAFFHVSNAVIELHGAVGHQGTDPFYLTFCPMARDGDGAYWLQTVDVVWNSFYGEKMLRCGSIKDEYAGAGTTEGANNAE